MPSGRTIRLLGAAGLLGLAACTREPAPPAPPAWMPGPGEFSVMTYNLGHYGYLDRDGDGQVNDTKPAPACEALHALIKERNPDILLVQELGDPTVWETFKQRLAEQGLKYNQDDWMEAPRGAFNLAILSRYGATKINHHAPTYKINGETEPMQRGFQEAQIQVATNQILRVINTHLKSKKFHPLGQNEMRRRASRLLGNEIEAWSGEGLGSDLLIAGCLNDDPESATLKNLLQPRTTTRLIDLNPQDSVGDRWTHVDDGLAHYTRRDYVLASPGLAERMVREKSGVVRDRRSGLASPHRPVYVVFRNR